MKSIHPVLLFFVIAATSLFLHWKDFSKDLMGAHVWRQAQTQTTIVNFYEEDMNILYPHKNERGNEDGLFRMEFPLMQWMIAVLYKLLGNHLIITRLCMFIIGLFTIAGMYKLVSSLFKERSMAMIAAWTFNFSPCFYYYTINPLPDNFALCCSIWGLAFFFTWINNNKLSSLLTGGFALSVGTLCKLPFILYYIVPAFFFFWYIRKSGFTQKTLVQMVIFFSFALLPVAWYAAVIGSWKGNGIVQGITETKVPFSTIAGYFSHHLFSSLPELLLNYGSLPFFIAGWWFLFKNKAYKNFMFPAFALLGLLVLFYFAFEINMIEKVHDYYLFPFFPLLFILVAYGASHLFKLKKQFRKIYRILIIMHFAANGVAKNACNVEP